MFSRFMLILPLILIINIINHKGEKKGGGGGVMVTLHIKIYNLLINMFSQP